MARRQPCPGCQKTRKRKPHIIGGVCEPCRWLQRQGKPLPNPSSSRAAADRAESTARAPRLDTTNNTLSDEESDSEAHVSESANRSAGKQTGSSASSRKRPRRAVAARWGPRSLVGKQKKQSRASSATSASLARHFRLGRRRRYLGLKATQKSHV